MSLIVGEGVGKSFGADYIFRNGSFRVAPGERIGLVGANGEGKTTLLRILAELDEPTEGSVQRKAGLRVGYLPQVAPELDDRTLWQSMQDVFADLLAMEAELAETAGRLHEDDDGRLLKRYGDLQARFEAAGGYDLETRIKTVLTGLGFEPAQYDRPLAEFSGGQRTRALLGRLLLADPDALLLDEPTNHLDLEAVEWLERYLQGFRQAVVIVSHDRYFLDRLTRWTWEISLGRLEVYRGGYSDYLKKREDRFRERMRQWQAQQEYIARTEDFIRRNISGQRTKEAQGRQKHLDRFLTREAIDKPRRPGQIHVRISPLQRTGDLVFRTGDLAIGYDGCEPLMTVGDLEVRRRERIALLGPNGAGKTTLLRTLLGDLAPKAGTVRLGANVSCGYLPQAHETLQADWTVLQAILDVDAHMTKERARTLLGSFLFRADEVFKPIAQLSGGERSRVIFARLSAAAPNVLLLDEPTNHLDLPSREIVQEMLVHFPGTILFVSHDRYLVQALATCVWALEDAAIHRLPGSWEAYVRWRTEHRAGLTATAPPDRRDRRQRRESNLKDRQRSKQRQRLLRRMEAVEQAIDELEKRLADLMDASGQAGEDGDLDRVRELGEQYEQTDAELKGLWREYVQLNEKLES